LEEKKAQRAPEIAAYKEQIDRSARMKNQTIVDDAGAIAKNSQERGAIITRNQGADKATSDALWKDPNLTSGPAAEVKQRLDNVPVQKEASKEDADNALRDVGRVAPISNPKLREKVNRDLEQAKGRPTIKAPVKKGIEDRALITTL
jgi:hypothetical protein